MRLRSAASVGLALFTVYLSLDEAYAFSIIFFLLE